MNIYIHVLGDLYLAYLPIIFIHSPTCTVRSINCNWEVIVLFAKYQGVNLILHKRLWNTCKCKWFVFISLQNEIFKVKKCFTFGHVLNSLIKNLAEWFTLELYHLLSVKESFLFIIFRSIQGTFFSLEKNCYVFDSTRGFWYM